MANISIADIKALREQLGTGMVDTKKALEEAGGDIEKATEILRRTGFTAEGDEHLVAEEYAVLDRVGRLQLPQEYLTTLGMRERVRLALESDHVGVWPHVQQTQQEEAVDDER